MSNGFEVQQVIGSGSAQELVCQFIHLGTPVEEIKEIRKTVIIDNCQVVFDKVIIDGRLRKDIMFKAADEGFLLPGNTQACTGVTRVICGAIKDVDVEIAFNALIPVPGARPGDFCVVLQAFVEGEKEEAADIRCTGAFETLIDKSIIFLCVKVVRDVITNNLTGAGVGAAAPMVSGRVTMIGGTQQQRQQVCPPRRSTGFFPGAVNGEIPGARPGLVQGTWVGPTLVFPGVINPGIPTTLPLPNPSVGNPGSIIQVTPATTDTDV